MPNVTFHLHCHFHHFPSHAYLFVSSSPSHLLPLLMSAVTPSSLSFPESRLGQLFIVIVTLNAFFNYSGHIFLSIISRVTPKVTINRYCHPNNVLSCALGIFLSLQSHSAHYLIWTVTLPPPHFPCWSQCNFLLSLSHMVHFLI